MSSSPEIWKCGGQNKKEQRKKVPTLTVRRLPQLDEDHAKKDKVKKGARRKKANCRNNREYA